MTTTKMTKYKNSFSSIPNEFIQPTPWSIYSRKDSLTGYAKPFMQTCGNKKLIVSGHMNVKDGLTIIALMDMSAKHKNIEFETSINEIVRELDTQYTPECKNSIRKSLFRIQKVSIKMIGYDEKGEIKRWIAYGIIDNADYDRDRKDVLKIRINKYWNKYWDWKLLTHFDRKFLMTGIKTDTAKQLYLFYQRQMSAGQRNAYKIGLEKLCKYIGYDRDGKQPLYLRLFSQSSG